MTTDARQILGQTGESLACAELERRGYAILARRFRTRTGEIDIVARDRDTVVFVEVKARAGTGYGDGAEAVTGWKQRRLAMVALEFLARHRLVGSPCRFDVVSIAFRDGQSTVEVYANAFGVA